MEVVNVFEKLSFFKVTKILLSSKEKIFFLRSNLISNFLSFLKIGRIHKLNWDLINLEKDNYKIITRIIENHEVDSFVYNFLSKLSKKKNLEKNFYHYLVKYFSNHKIIGNFSVENILVLFDATDILFENKIKHLHLETSDFDNFIEEKYSSNNRIFYFTKKFPTKILSNYFSVVKKFIYIFNFEKLPKYKNKSAVIMDPVEINYPNSFFPKKNFYDKLIFLTNQNILNYDRLVKFYKFIDLKVIFLTIKFYFSVKDFNKNKLIKSLYLNYYFEKLIFKKIFKDNNIKKFITAYVPQTFSSSAIAAIQEVNGKSFGFTMSYSESYSSHLNIDAFDYFISINNANYKKKLNSNLKIITNLGYIGDYKFKKKKEEAIELRNYLQKNGAKYVIGLFDQGNAEDEVFQIGYHVYKKGYEFLLNKMLSNKALGLIIKPKKPRFLKQKLGDSYNLLLKAKETGRLIVFDKHPEYHSKNFEDIPAKVGFASNITIHDTLLAGTAGLESALTGCKSLYFDYHNSKKSLFLKNNLKIVFNDWKVLWDHIEKDIKIGDPSLGNWDEVIDQFDKYRDGNTNLRMIDFFEKN